MPITPAQALQMLRTDTEGFLNRYPVRIFGDPTASYQAKYRLEDATASLPAGSVPQRPGSVLRHLRHHDTQLFNIKAGVSVGPNVAGAIWFDAHSVKMWDAAKPNNIVPYTLPAAGGASLMVTGELTGCSFAIHDNNDGSLLVTHIKPHLPVAGEHQGNVIRAQPSRPRCRATPIGT